MTRPSGSAARRPGRPGRLAAALLLAALAVLVSSPATGQYRNIGGKNKITHDTFDWKVYQSPHFQIYYYPEVEPFLEKLVSYAESAYLKVSTTLDYQLGFKVPVFFYKTHGEFEQTNITMSMLPEGVGAFATPSKNRIVIPIDDPPDKMQTTLTHELVHIYQYDMFYQSDLSKAYRSSPPLWIMEGMAEFVGQEGWSTSNEAVIRDAVLNDMVPPILELNDQAFLTYRFGQAAFDYMNEEWGLDGVRDFIQAFRRHITTRNLEKVVDEAFGVTPEEFDTGFRRYLRGRFIRGAIEKDEPADYGKEIGIKGNWVHTFSPAFSPSGELVAVLTNMEGEVDLVLISAEDGEVVKNLTKGYTTAYEYIVVESFSGKNDVAWSPDGNTIAVFVRRERGRDLLLVNAITGRKMAQVTMPDLFENASPAFSPDSKRILFAANKDGVVDIFEYEIATGNIRNITQDDFWDTNPTYSPDGDSCVYNRRINGYEKLIKASLSDPGDKTQLTFGEHDDIQAAYAPDGKRVYFTSDESGIFNFSILDLETLVVSVYTNVVSSVNNPIPLASTTDAERVGFTSFFKGKFRLYEMELGEPLRTIDPPAEEEVPDLDEQEDFKPDLELTIDEEDKQEYQKYKFFVESADAIAGISDLGDLITSSYISLSDMSGDQRIQIMLQSLYTYSNIEATYFNTRKRYDWGIHLFDLRDYFVYYDPTSQTGVSRNNTFRRTGASLFSAYPVSKFHRFEGSVGYLFREHWTPAVQDNTIVDYVQVNDHLPFVGLSFIGDTARYASFGPIHGRKYTMGVSYAPKLGSQTAGYTDVQLEYRNYFQMTKRSLIAHRLFAFGSFSDVPNFRTFGGMNTMRSWDFRDFVGSRTVFSNLEFRFPLVDNVAFPFGMQLREIRGLLFWDIGSAWWDETGYEFSAVDENGDERFKDVYSAVGWGFHLFFGPFQLHWDFGKRWDLADFESGFRTAFWIGYEF
jgi:WD40 repeat protein